MPLQSLQELYKKHEQYAQLALQYPEARAVKDTMALHVVEAYRRTFDPTAMPATASKAADAAYAIAKRVAVEDRLIAWPKFSLTIGSHKCLCKFTLQGRRLSHVALSSGTRLPDEIPPKASMHGEDCEVWTTHTVPMRNAWPHARRVPNA